MQYTLIIGGAVRCADGKAGSVGGLIVNPNRNHVDYVVLDPGPLGGREYYLPSGQIQRASAGELILPLTWDELEDLPHEEVWPEQGTVQDNLPDLCVARAGTPVRNAEGSRLGTFHGAVVDGDFEIQGILLENAPGAAIPISRIARHGDNADEIVVHLARQAAI